MMEDRNLSPPKPEDFSGGAVQKAVLKQTIQHPLTTLPAAVAGTAAFWLMVIDHDPVWLGVAIGAGLLSAGTWVFNYFFRGETLARQHVDKLRAREEESERQKMRDFQNEFAYAHFEEGAKECKELEAAYVKLRDFLTKKSGNSGNVSTAQFLSLAEDTYKKGNDFLRAALEVYKAIRSNDTDQLEKEITGWEKELRKKGIDESDAKLLTAKVESHKRRLTICAEKEHRLKDLLRKVNEQENSLEISYLELIELSESRLDSPLTSTTTNEPTSLDRAIGIAKKVEERLRKAGGMSEEDQMYLKAASKKSSE